MDGSLPVLLCILACILAEGFFSGSEIALVSLNRLRLRHRVEQGSKTALLIERSLRNPERLLSTTLVGNNLAVFTSNTLATLWIIQNFGQHRAWLAVPIMVPLLLLFGEMIPKSLYQERAETLTRLLIYPLRFVSALLAPVVALVSACARLLLRAFGLQTGEVRRLLNREDLHALAEQYGRGQMVGRLEEKMIQRLLHFSEKTAREVMKPLVDVVAIERDMPREKLAEIVLKYHYTRYPICERRVDNTIRILHTFDLLGAGRDAPLSSLLRPAHFAAENVQVDKLLLDLQAEGQPMAVIVDEYGAAIGIATMEDIVEEVVGGIPDEFARRQSHFRQLSPRVWLVEGRAEIEAIEEIIGLGFPQRDFETLAGFLLNQMGKIPEVGEVCHYQGAEFRIMKANERTIQEVQISLG
jgi:putative hemolysin